MTLLMISLAVFVLIIMLKLFWKCIFITDLEDVAEAEQGKFDIERISRRVNSYFDKIGYGPRQRKTRIKSYDKMSKANSRSHRQIRNDNCFEKKFVGSKGEGIGTFFENDTDILEINNNILCIEENQYYIIGKQRPVFFVDRTNMPPGYCTLRLNSEFDRTKLSNNIKRALVERDGAFYLSSKKYMEINTDIFYRSPGLIAKSINYETSDGPSLPKWTEKLIGRTHIKVKMDLVRAFPYHCPNKLSQWCNRQKEAYWLAPNIIEYVMRLPLFVVPIGKRESIDEDLQFRISFVKAENYLIKSLNEVQTKVYIFLRQYTKFCLRPYCKNLTSYMMKNIILWLAEKENNFDRIDQILEYFLKAIHMLTDCIKILELKNFMMEDKNMFHKKISKHEQKNLIEILNKVDWTLRHYPKEVLFFCRTLGYKSQLYRYLQVHNQLDQMQMKLINLYDEQYITRYYNNIFKYKSSFGIYSKALAVCLKYTWIYGLFDIMKLMFVLNRYDCYQFDHRLLLDEIFKFKLNYEMEMSKNSNKKELDYGSHCSELDYRTVMFPLEDVTGMSQKGNESEKLCNEFDYGTLQAALRAVTCLGIFTLPGSEAAPDDFKSKEENQNDKKQTDENDSSDNSGDEEEEDDKLGYKEEVHEKSGYEEEDDKLGYKEEVHEKSGYEEEVHEKSGYEEEVHNKSGYKEEVHEKSGYEEEVHNKLGYKEEVHEKSGYKEEVHDKLGYKEEVHEKSGYEEEVHDKLGYKEEVHEKSGYEEEVHNKSGYKEKIHDKSGDKEQEHDKSGYKEDVHNKSVYEEEVHDKSGYEEEEHEKSGYEEEVHNKSGYKEKIHDKSGDKEKVHDKSGYKEDVHNKSVYEEEVHDKSGYEEEHDKSGYEEEVHCNSGDEEEVHDKLGDEEEVHDNSGDEEEVHDKSGYEEEEHDDKSGYEEEVHIPEYYETDLPDNSPINEHDINRSLNAKIVSLIRNVSFSDQYTPFVTITYSNRTLGYLDLPIANTLANSGLQIDNIQGQSSSAGNMLLQLVLDFTICSNCGHPLRQHRY